MQKISSWHGLMEAIKRSSAAPRLLLYAGRLSEFKDEPLSRLCSFIIIEPADRLADLQNQLRPPLHPPQWEYVDRACGWYELVLVTGDSGFGHVVLVPDEAAIDPEILEYCRTLTT